VVHHHHHVKISRPMYNMHSHISTQDKRSVGLYLPKTVTSISYCAALIQTYQVSRISRETPAFWSHHPLSRRITKISRISSTKFGQLILSKTVKIVATRCHILRLKSAKFHFGWGSAPDPARGTQRFPRPMAGFKGSCF